MSEDTKATGLDALTRDAIALLRLGRVEEAAPIVDRMCELLADQPETARQMQRIVALMSFQWDADRRPVRLVPVAPPRPSDVEIVAFHAAATKEAQLPAFEYGALLAQLFESARLIAPQCRRILITDDHTALPDLGAGVEVLRVALDPEHLMYERMRVQHEFLRRRFPATATVFVDADVIVNADPSTAFGEDFDVGLTHRPVVDAPFNGGVIFVGAGAGGARFFEKALACYEAMAEAPTIAPLYPRSLKCWWGDQFALAALVGWRALAERGEQNAVAVDGLRVRVFPCETHNYTIEARAYAPRELESKYFVHFKGPRKAMMAPYLDALRTRAAR